MPPYRETRDYVTQGRTQGCRRGIRRIRTKAADLQDDRDRRRPRDPPLLDRTTLLPAPSRSSVASHRATLKRARYVVVTSHGTSYRRTAASYWLSEEWRILAPCPACPDCGGRAAPHYAEHCQPASRLAEADGRDRARVRGARAGRRLEAGLPRVLRSDAPSASTADAWDPPAKEQIRARPRSAEGLSSCSGSRATATSPAAASSAT